MVGVFLGLSSHHLPSLSRLATTCHTRTHTRQWSKDDKVFPFASPTTMCAAPAGQATSAIRAKARLIEAAGFCWLHRASFVLTYPKSAEDCKHWDKGNPLSDWTKEASYPGWPSFGLGSLWTGQPFRPSYLASFEDIQDRNGWPIGFPAMA